MGIRVGLHTMMRGAMGSRDGTMAVARAAERLGFSHIGINDHVVVPNDVASKYPYTEAGNWPGVVFGECLEMLTTMAFVAGCTEKIEILSSVMILPYRPAVLTAKMLTTADLLSNGRIILGAGVGWMPEEFEALGAPPFKERGAVTDEWLAAFKELWTKDDPHVEGRYTQSRNIRFLPKPSRAGGLPIWIGGESTIALKRTVRFGNGWYPASNNPQQPLDTPERLSAMFGKLDALAGEAGRDPAELTKALVYLQPVEWTASTGKDRRMFQGSSGDMVGDMQRLEAAGCTHISLLFQTATLGETLERMQRFSEDVLAKLA